MLHPLHFASKKIAAFLLGLRIVFSFPLKMFRTRAARLRMGAGRRHLLFYLWPPEPAISYSIRTYVQGGGFLFRRAYARFGSEHA